MSTMKAILLGGLLTMVGGAFTQFSTYYYQAKLNQAQEKEFVYAAISGFAEELSQTFSLYAGHEVSLARLEKKFTNNPSAEVLRLLTSEQTAVSEYALNIAKLRQELLQIFGKIRLYYKLTPELERNMQIVRDARSVNPIEVPTEGEKGNLSTTKGDIEVKSVTTSENITNFVAKKYTDRLYEIEKELLEQLK